MEKTGKKRKNNENGILLPMNDADKMAEAMEKLIENKTLALSMGEKAKNIVNEYNAVTVCKQWEEYLVEVANKQKEE